MPDSYIPKIALTSGQVELIKGLIKDEFPKAKVYLFGSRANGTAKKYSDVDLAIDNKQKIDFTKLSILQEKIADKLPYLVDLVDLNSVSGEFRGVVLKGGKSL